MVGNGFDENLKIMRKTILILAFLAVLVLPACNTNTHNDNRLIIATLRGPSSVGMIKMIDSLSVIAQSDIEICIFNEPMQVRKMMLEGSADFAVLPTTMAALIYNKGVDYQLVGVPIWGTLYLCGIGDTIGSWQQLRGSKVYLMAKGMNPDILFRYLLVRNGLEPYVDVALDYRFPTHIDLANATMAGRAPLSVISEPFLSQALNTNKALHIFLDLSDEWTASEGMPLPETAFVCRSAVDDSSCAKVVEAYKQSVEWVVAHPDSAALLSAKHGINPDTLALLNSVGRSHFKFMKTTEIKTIVTNYLQVFYNLDPQTIGDQMPDERFFR